MSSSHHSAAGQAAGYQYQSEQALLSFLQRRQDRLTLFVERLDDFHVAADDSVMDIVEVKHHGSGSEGDLSDTSADLWRTINVWITVLQDLEAEEVPNFLLLTTATAGVGSIASALRDDPAARDPETALARLIEVATSDGAKTTETWRTRFASLHPDTQASLVSAITVADAQPTLSGIPERLKKECSLFVRKEHLEAFVERLRGWWFSRIAEMLTRKREAVAIEDLRFFIQELRDGFSLDNLPFEHDVPDPTTTEQAVYAESTFTKQLRIVRVSEGLIAHAIRDYHQAYANSSRWAREGLLVPGELSSYETRLVNEWDRHFERMRQELGDEVTDVEKEDAGRALWASLDAGSFPLPPIRKSFDEMVLPRGTLHRLADAERVGWHPEFRERLKQLLTASVTP